MSTDTQSTDAQAEGQVAGRHPAPGQTGEDNHAQPWWSTLLRALVHGGAAFVFAWPLTLLNGAMAAALGSTLGALLAPRAARSRLRLWTLLGLSTFAFASLLLFRQLWGAQETLASLYGPATAARLGDILFFGAAALSVSFTLRTLSARLRALTLVEAVAVALSFATLLVAHRHGAIHRPFIVADRLIERGEDPVIGVLLIAAVGALMIALLFLSERSLGRALVHLLVMAILLLAVLGTTAINGLPTPPSAGGALGLQDDDAEARAEREAQGGGGQGGGAGGRSSEDELQFHDNYPSGGATPDAVVIFHDDYSAPNGYYYFRQGAFSQYNGRKLVRATAMGVDVDVQNAFPSYRARDVRSTPPEGDTRALVETTVALMANNSAPLALESATRFIPSSNPSPERFRRMYRVRSRALDRRLIELLGRRAGDSSWDEATRTHYLEGPADGRYAALLTTLLADLPPDLADEPLARALAITGYLSEGGTYSLQSRHADADDPTADFLFGDLTGYCVHFAHAAVFLMRSAGLPSRVGTGYAVAEANRQGGSALLLRSADQHAWPEVYIDGVGWIVADVSPANNLSPPGEPPDPQLQRLLGDMARGATALEDEPRAAPRPMSELARDAGSYLWRTILAFIVGLFVFSYLRKSWRRFRPHLPGAETGDVYRACLDSLGDLGHRRAPGESHEAFSLRLRSAFPALTTLTASRIRAMFGASDSESSSTMAPAARDLRQQLSSSAPLWRRILAHIDPLSHWFTR